MLKCILRSIVVEKGNEFGFNHKITIEVQESLPNIMVTRNLRSASLGKELVV